MMTCSYVLPNNYRFLYSLLHVSVTFLGFCDISWFLYTVSWFLYNILVSATSRDCLRYHHVVRFVA